MIEAIRIGDGPIIHAGLDASLGDNINGPSLIRRPAWAPGPGRYMLYFAHHKGRHIRLAFADDLAGPWQVYPPGVLPLRETPLAHARPATAQPQWARETGQDGLYPHLASPDLWIDDDAERFHMLFHGLGPEGEQVSYQACSRDGIGWEVIGAPIDETYLRRFRYDGEIYAMARASVLMRARSDGGFDHGPMVVSDDVRHVAVLVQNGRVHVLFTRIGDAPERIFHTELSTTGDWWNWRAGVEAEILRPRLAWEGAGERIRPSFVGAVGFCNELRDPCFFAEAGEVFMVYAGGGEAALGLARLHGI